MVIHNPPQHIVPTGVEPLRDTRGVCPSGPYGSVQYDASDLLIRDIVVASGGITYFRDKNGVSRYTYQGCANVAPSSGRSNAAGIAEHERLLARS